MYYDLIRLTYRVLSILPHWYAAYIAESRGAKFDNVNPRHGHVALQNKLTKEDFGLYQRAEGAQQNGFENLPLFAAALIAGHWAKLPTETINNTALFYLGSRVLYTFLYLNITNLKYAGLRSVVFVSGVVACLRLFVKAGQVANSTIL